MVVRVRRAQIVDVVDEVVLVLQILHVVDHEALVGGARERALRRCTVVTDDHVDQRVVERPHLLDGVDQPADVVVGVGQEPGVHLHLPCQHRLDPIRHLVPRRDAGAALGQRGVGRDHTELLLPGERLLADGVPALVELPLVAVRPVLRDVVRSVRGARREVHEERPVRGQRLLLARPGDRLVRHVVHEVVAVLGGAPRLDRRRVLVDRRVPLVRLPAEEAVEVLEPAARVRPVIERSDRARLPHRHLVALAELRCAVAVELEDLRQRSARVRPQRVVARRRRGDLGDPTHPHRVMVAPRQQRSTRRRAQRGRVESGVLQPVRCKAIERRRLAGPAERARRPETDVIDQDHDDVRCPRWWPQPADRRVLGVRRGGVERDRPGIDEIGDRKRGARQLSGLDRHVTSSLKGWPSIAPRASSAGASFWALVTS